MKKKLLALAVAGAFVAPAAMADTANVNVYGVVNMSFDSTSTGTGCVAASPAVCVATQSASNTKISSNQSRFGIKGSEDLGGGMNAFFQVEQLINPDDASAVATNGVLATRNSFVGIGGESWGSVLLGTNDSPYKTSTRGMDLFGDTLGDNRSLMGGIKGKSSALAFDGRPANVLQYDSPNLSGFKVSLQYHAGAETAAANASKGNAYSLSGTYAQGPMNLVAAYETHDFGAGAGDLIAIAPAAADQKEKSYKLGGSYTMDQITGILVYEKTSDDFAAANKKEHRSWYLAGKFAISGSDAVKLAYTNVGNLNSVANTGAKQISLGYDHAMSKRTTVYALYTKLTNDSAINYTLGINGTTGVAAPSGFDADPSAFQIGVKHSF
ncbi:MAG: outer membrane protein (porin) [Gallionellaceae bacterium]|nr:MAG: outer membrane protein (porin) [Gallionellaceae bacterium]